MARIILFSRYFPAYHPKAGQPTYFVEKVLNGLLVLGIDRNVADWPIDFYKSYNLNIDDLKYHTIRAGHRFKVGDKFSPRVWSGKPYRSKQIIIAPDCLVESVWDFVKRGDQYFVNGIFRKFHTMERVAQNDGLSWGDFVQWFPEKFDGQIICWRKDVFY